GSRESGASVSARATRDNAVVIDRRKEERIDGTDEGGDRGPRDPGGAAGAARGGGAGRPARPGLPDACRRPGGRLERLGGGGGAGGAGDGDDPRPAVGERGCGPGRARPRTGDPGRR